MFYTIAPVLGGRLPLASGVNDMTQQQLECELAMALGEDLREIKRLGFSVADPMEVNFDPEPDLLPPSVIDWDELYC